MDLLSYLANLLGSSAAERQSALAYYGWLIGPVVVAFILAALALVKALPRQRRREDLSGQERRVR